MCDCKRKCCCSDRLSSEVVPTEKGLKVDIVVRGGDEGGNPKRTVICCRQTSRKSAADECCSCD